VNKPQSLALQRQLIAQLASGELRSGEWLAEQAGISRAAIARHIDQLQEIGLDIYSIKGKGYRLAQAISLLDINQMKAHQPNLAAEILLQHLTDSTNSQLLKKIQDGQAMQRGAVLVAEAQSAGRGRRGNTWISPFGSNLYFSMYWPLEQGIQAAMGLSLVVAVAVAELLEQHYQLPIKLKWPNDIYLGGQKLGGILVELAGQSHAHCDVVIGLGLNVQMPAGSASAISQPFTDLAQHVSAPIDRNWLVPALQQQLCSIMQQFEQSGFSAYVNRFNQRDLWHGQTVTISSATTQHSGVCRGVDQQGALLLEQNGVISSYYGGELSLRGNVHG
jgi:BirA family biotin operon repressor/biotin-[acetyl-CoA-carboxylase] ligase